MTSPTIATGAVAAQAVADVATSLGVAVECGLSSEEAAARLATGGPNEFDSSRRVSLAAPFFDAATEPFVLLLGFAGVLALLLGEVRDGVLILIGLIPIVGADVITEYRSERALESLREAAAPHARVRRVPGLAEAFVASPLSVADLLLVGAVALAPAVVSEIVRTFWRSIWIA